MNLVFLRHAIAEERHDFSGADDSLRPLTSTGIKEFTSFLKFIEGFMCKPDLILSSPYKRTKQTSEIVKQVYGGDIEFIDFLKPGGSSKKLLEYVQNRTDENIFLVGHQPDLGQHLSYFVKNTQNNEWDSLCEFKKGGFVWLKSVTKIDSGKINRGEFQIKCSLHPPQLRKLKLLKS